jgi:hypothetical protein
MRSVEHWQFALMNARHLCRWALGRILGAIRLHRVERVWIEGAELIRKRRRLAAALIIPPGNVYLRMMGNPSIVLSRHRWLAWERAVDEGTGRQLLANVETDAHSLWCRRVAGIPLQQLLADDSVALEQKIEANRWSIIALRALHACTADWGDGRRQPISHGDATASNVIVDLPARIACWIDFETRHLPAIPELDRHADDLRALITSAALHLSAASDPRLTEVLVTAVGDKALLARFQERLRDDWSAPTVAQLAQAPLPWSRYQTLREALLTTLAKQHMTHGFG